MTKQTKQINYFNKHCRLLYGSSAYQLGLDDQDILSAIDGFENDPYQALIAFGQKYDLERIEQWN